MGWLDRLGEVEERKTRVITLHNTEEDLESPLKEGISTRPEPSEKNSNAPRVGTDKTDKRYQDADEFGLCASWSYVFGYVSLHDPTTGEWHDIPTKEAPSWAIGEARKRKELYRDGNRKAYRLTSSEMEEIWEAEYVPEPEGLVEDHPVEEEE